jgi:Ca2+-binding EF-hand superfamily protein
MMMSMANIQGVENTGYISGESDEDFDRRMNEIIETARQARINRGGSLGATSLYESPETTTSADPAAAQLMSFMDINGDGKITMEEAPEELKTAFAFIDQNGDGGIDVKEAQVMVDFDNGGQSPVPAAATVPDYTAEQLMSFMDTNGDGKIAKDEVNRLMISFGGLDKNGDGEIDAAEAGGIADVPRKAQTPSPQQATKAVTPEQIMAFIDANSDGKITMEEAPEDWKAGFSFIDANGDGGIDLNEVQVIAEFDKNKKEQSTQPQPTDGVVTAEQLMAFMDSNSDGKITMEEAPEELKPAFAFIDQNAHGGIDLKEAQIMADFENGKQSPATAIATEPTAEQLMSFMDINRDGQITLDEAPEDLKTGFAFIDQNGDGGIDVKEAQIMVDFGNNGQSPDPMAGGIDMSDRKNRFANPAETFTLEMGFGLATMKAKARVKPMQKIAADIQLVDMAREAGVGTVEEAVDHFAGRLLSIPLGDETWIEMVAWMYDAVGSSRLDYEAPDSERVLRRLAHLIMSLPEYQLN